MDNIYRAAADALERGESAALITIVATGGSTPQRVGAKMLAYADGRTEGTIGGGCYEHDALGKAREAIRLGRPRLVHYTLNDDLAAESGLICGGQMDVYIEPLVPASHLYLVGAGHISHELARVTQALGFQLHVLDDRGKFASEDRFPGAEVVVDDIPRWLESASLPPSAYVVVVTRGHRHDLDALRVLVNRDTRYLGLIGSRSKVLKIFEALTAEGVAAERLDRVHAPIGLDIGAVSPAEIAVSIAAELVAARSGRLTEPHVAAASLKHTLNRL
jgi:xanthine dehydrogenase accessory factor